MDQPGLVRRGEASAGLQKDIPHLSPGARSLLEPGAQGESVDELHGDEHRLAEGANLVHGDDVGMGETGHGLSLSNHACLSARPISLLRSQELDGDTSVQLGIVGGVDDAHRAAADRLEHDEAPDLGAPLRHRILLVARALCEAHENVPTTLTAVDVVVHVDELFLFQLTLHELVEHLVGEAGHGRSI